MKKLKNPEKYIRQLKKRIVEVEQAHARTWDLFRERAFDVKHLTGEEWFSWAAPKCFSAAVLSVANLHPGDEVIMVGKITEIHQTLDGNSAVMEFGEVRVRR